MDVGHELRPVRHSRRRAPDANNACGCYGLGGWEKAGSVGAAMPRGHAQAIQSEAQVNLWKRIAISAAALGCIVGCATFHAVGVAADSGIHSNDPTERGLSYVAAAIIVAAVIRAVANK